MPAARPNSSKSSKSKASKLHLTSKPCTSKSSSSNGPKRFACLAWWCNSTYGRRADMMKHIDAEHFGKRYCCSMCHAVMKQSSNLTTHFNTHLSSHSTICSCGRGFKDPSAYTKHRQASGHSKGYTHGKIRPRMMEGIKVQHIAGLALNLERISDPSFIPPDFDISYHLKGMPMSKGQEKYNQTDYVELPDAPTAPIMQLAAPLLAGGAAAEYCGTQPSVPEQTEIRVEELGINVDYSYDVELPQEVPNETAYADCHYTLILYPAHGSQIPSDGQLPPYPTTNYQPTASHYAPLYYPSHSLGAPPQHSFPETWWGMYDQSLPLDHLLGANWYQAHQPVAY